MNAVSGFTMLETGWSPETAKSDLAFSAAGAALASDLRGVAGAQEIGNPAGSAEEVCAVLEGSFRLQSDADVYELAAGQAVLIPKDAARRWTLLSATGTLYRVWRGIA